jgi:hypothetical protein
MALSPVAQYLIVSEILGVKAKPSPFIISRTVRSRHTKLIVMHHLIMSHAPLHSSGQKLHRLGDTGVEIFKNTLQLF